MTNKSLSQSSGVHFSCNFDWKSHTEQQYQYLLSNYIIFAALSSSFFFSLIIMSILLYPYFYMSKGYFFFVVFYPNNEINCFFKIYVLFSDPKEGKFICLIVSSPLLMKMGFVWSNWLGIVDFFSLKSFSCRYVLKCDVTCEFFVEQK